MDFVGGCGLFIVLFHYFTVGTPKILSGARRLRNRSSHYGFIILSCQYRCLHLAADPTRLSAESPTAYATS
jgi:hypothetical protein